MANKPVKILAPNDNKPAFKQVSLPAALLEQIRRAAEQAHRSVPAQIEHCFLLATTMETIIPPKTANDAKKGLLPATDLLSGLLQVLSNPPAPPPGWRINFDPHEPSKAWQTAPDGTVTHGRLLDNGVFIPNSHETDQTSA